MKAVIVEPSEGLRRAFEPDPLDSEEIAQKVAAAVVSALEARESRESLWREYDRLTRQWEQRRLRP